MLVCGTELCHIIVFCFSVCIHLPKIVEDLQLKDQLSCPAEQMTPLFFIVQTTLLKSNSFPPSESTGVCNNSHLCLFFFFFLGVYRTTSEGSSGRKFLNQCSQSLPGRVTEIIFSLWSDPVILSTVANHRRDISLFILSYE